MTALGQFTHAHIAADMKLFCGNSVFWEGQFRSVTKGLIAGPRAASRLSQAASSMRAVALAAARFLRFGTKLGGIVAMAGPCFVCGNPVAPFGFGWPGFARDKPEGKRGYLWACAEHRQDGERRREAAIAAFYGRRATTTAPHPTKPEKGPKV